MSLLLIVLVSVIVYVLGYTIYATYISRAMRVDDSRETPAHTLRDELDYVPSRPFIVFSHHFATIAGAGPILGPTIALIYGLVPALIWIIVGAVFIGAVHDYTSLFVSLREKGRSIAEVTARVSGKLGFFLYITFTILLIVLVCAAFLQFSVSALTSTYEASHFGVDLSGGILPVHTFVKDGVKMIRIGGIATTSVLIITALAPVIGFLVYKKRINTLLAIILAGAFAVFSVIVGFYFPIQFVNIPDSSVRLIWMLILGAYVLIASSVPVWILLQPRDFTNSMLLYFGMGLMLTSVVVGGLFGLSTEAPLFSLRLGTEALGFIWPVMFITIACGAISGFHSLVSSGTSSKQCDKEGHAKVIGFSAMLLESLLAVLVICAVASGLGFNKYLSIAWPKDGVGNPVLAFALGLGGLLSNVLHIPIYLGTIFGILMLEGFLVTTLDSAVRLNRYLLEELWKFSFGRFGQAPEKVPAFLRNPYFNSLLTMVAAFLLAFPNAYTAIWPLFGTANQMMAALTLITVSLWLAYRARPVWYTVLPAIFMVTTTMASLIIINVKTIHKLQQHFKPAEFSLLVLGIILLFFSIGVVFLGVIRAWEFMSGKAERLTEAEAA